MGFIRILRRLNFKEEVLIGSEEDGTEDGARVKSRNRGPFDVGGKG